MYWQKRLDRENPDKELEEKIVEIRKANKDMDIVEWLENFVIKDIL